MTVQQADSMIRAERRRQDRTWGGRAHDDTHLFVDWRRFMAEHTAKALDAIGDNAEARRRVIEVAALGYASLESAQRAVEHLMQNHRD